MNQLIPLLIAAGGGVAYFWPTLKEKIPFFSGGTSDTPPHTEVTTIMNFFTKKNYKPGLDSAMDVGKKVYDALSHDAEETIKSHAKTGDKQ